MRISTFILVASLATVTLTAASDGFARQRSGSVTTGKGHTFNRAVGSSYDRSTHTGTRTVTGINGKTRTATATGNGDGTRSGTVTNGNGQTATYNGSTVKNTDGSVTNTGSVTGPNGQTATRSATTDVDPATGTTTRTVTSPSGETRDITVQGTTTTTAQ